MPASHHCANSDRRGNRRPCAGQPSAEEWPMRILLADAFPQPHLQQLADRGHHCVYEPDLTSGELAEHLADCTALVVRSTRVPAEVLDSADSLRLVIRAGSGTNTIDCAAASRNGIAVCNVRSEEHTSELQSRENLV